MENTELSTSMIAMIAQELLEKMMKGDDFELTIEAFCIEFGKKLERELEIEEGKSQADRLAY